MTEDAAAAPAPAAATAAAAAAAGSAAGAADSGEGAGGQDASSGGGGGAAAMAVEEKWENHFVSDAFWLTLRSIGIGLVPALQELDSTFRQIQDVKRRPGHPHQQYLSGWVRSYNALSGIVYADRMLSSLMGFYGLVSRWLSQLPAEQLATVPEHIISDMASVLEHLVTFVPTQLLAATPPNALGPCVGVVVDLLRRGKVCRNAMVRDSLAKLLRRLLESDRHPSTADLATVASDALLAGDRVATSNGLMLLYVELGKVLDTNGVVFDKNSARQGIAELIATTLGLAATGGGGAVGGQLGVEPAAVVASEVWCGFSDALLQESVFLLQDAMGRLGDLRGMQTEMENAMEWRAQPEDIQR
jgi:hypothetical protein